jgi:hypothetical protein
MEQIRKAETRRQTTTHSGNMECRDNPEATGFDGRIISKADLK